MVLCWVLGSQSSPPNLVSLCKHNFGSQLSVINSLIAVTHNTSEVLSQATAWLILTLGICVFIFNPAAKIWGKRPVYVFASIILFVVSVWGAVANTYPSFLGSRIVGALGMAPYEVLVQATINDLYFVHQRATRIAVWNLFLLCGICGAGFISGYIIEDLGYQWAFGVCAILFGIFGIGILFLVPETITFDPML